MGALRGDTDQALTVHVEICPEKKKKKKQSPSKVVNLRRVELYWEMDPRQKKGADPPHPPQMTIGIIPISVFGDRAISASHSRSATFCCRNPMLRHVAPLRLMDFRSAGLKEPG